MQPAPVFMIFVRDSAMPTLYNFLQEEAAMKIWYRSYTRIGHDPEWKRYEEDPKRYVQKVARPGTTVDVHGVEKMALRRSRNYSRHARCTAWGEIRCRRTIAVISRSREGGMDHE